MSGGGMVLHAGRRIARPGVIRTTTLCGRMNARSRDGMNIAGTDEAVTCKFCLAKMPPSGSGGGAVPMSQPAAVCGRAVTQIEPVENDQGDGHGCEQ